MNRRNDPDDFLESLFDACMDFIKWALVGVIALLMCAAVVAYAFWSVA